MTALVKTRRHGVEGGVSEGSTVGREEESARRRQCSVCGKEFEPRFSYQLQERDGELVAFCSARCQLRAMTSNAAVKCTACGTEFVPEYAYQTAVFDGQRVHFCSMECRGAGVSKPKPIERLAVYNLKGGTGKTTTAVSLASALASMGVRVLLVDADPQGSIGVSLGAKARRGLYQILVLGVEPASCAVTARENLDVILSDRALAGAEVYLAGRPERHRVMRDRFASLSGYDITIVDCSPSVGLLSQNALRLADSVIIPVSTDYLGVVGLQQAVRIMADLEKRTGHRIKLVGVLPTFHDGRLRVCRDAMETLRRYHGEFVLPPIRVNAKLKEAPSQRLTIFEHSKRSSGAADYYELSRWLMTNHLLREPPPVEAETSSSAPEPSSTASSQMPGNPFEVEL